MLRKSAKEIGENILLNPEMIIWNYYEPFERVYNRIKDSEDIAKSLDEIHAKTIGVIALSYQSGLLNNKEVLILCNKIDSSGRLYMGKDHKKIIENTNTLLALYKSLDSVALAANQTNTIENFEFLLSEIKKDKPKRFMKKILKNTSPETLWKFYRDSLNGYMDCFRSSFITQDEYDIRFHESPYSSIIDSFMKEQNKEFDIELRNTIITVLDMPQEADHYYDFRMKFYQNLLQNAKEEKRSKDLMENLSAKIRLSKVLSDAAKKKLDNQEKADDMAILSYVANELYI